MVTLLAVIAVFSILILAHEFGHFTAAKACGIFVEDFSLGMGPKLLQYKGKETSYTLRPIPIGGWCKMRGEDEESNDPRSFKSQPVWQQMIVIFAGPLMNFILAAIIFIVVFMLMGTPSNQNVVGEIISGSPAEQANLQAGDVVIEINGYQIEDWEDINAQVNAAEEGQSVNLVIERDGEASELVIEPYFDEEFQTWLIGISPQIEHEDFWAAISMGFKQTVQFTIMFAQGLWQMITGQIEADIAGPVGIISLVGQSTQYGIQSVLILAGFLSINLGFINLLPIPALDGGRLVFLIIEAIRRKPINQAKEGIIHLIGFVLLIGFLILVTINDVMRLIEG